MNQRTIGDFTRISKTAANKRYNDGKEVYMAACNINPDGMMGACCVSKKEEDDTFEKTVNSFSYYNCINSETGKYPAYYVKG